MDAQMQEDELVVLESIYPDQVIRHPDEAAHGVGGQHVSIRIDINLAQSAKIVCRHASLPVDVPRISHDVPGPATVRPRPGTPRQSSHKLPADSSKTLSPSANAFSPTALQTAPPTSTPAIPSIAITTPVLPPLHATLHLPAAYPRSAAPELTALRTRPQVDGCWLPARTSDRLGTELQRLWAVGSAQGQAQGEAVLWEWVDWVAGGGFLEGGSAEGDITKDSEGAYTIPTASPTSLHTLLRAHLAHSAASTFASTSFSCGICFESKKGRACLSLPCMRACVFCVGCLEACWALAIREGTVEGVACPGFECTKARVKPDGEGCEEGVQLELVQKVVGDQLAERWVWLKEKKKVENDPTYTICPLQHCQAPVPPPPTSQPTKPIKTARIFRLGGVPTDTAPPPPEDAEKRQEQAQDEHADRFRQCPACQFSFCRFCNKTWHGTAPCPLPSTASFLQKYMALPEGSAERASFERRYGRKQLTRMVAEWEEQQANKDWFDKFTRACPGCSTRVNKSAGCNHMTCSKCQAHFCYRCGTKLRPADPYHHYRTPGSSCFEKLFDADEIARFEREVVGGEGFEDEFGLGMAQEGWIGDVFPLQGNGGWW